MKVTDITKQRHGDRYNLFVDGDFAAGLSAGVLADSGLRRGQEITAAELGRLVARDDYGRVLAKAYDFLSRRPHGSEELRTKLLHKDYDGKLIDEAFAHLTELGYLDDADFARRWAALRGSSRGPIKLRQELRQKRLPDELIEQALAERAEEHDELQEAVVLARKRLDRLRGHPWETVYARLSRYLSGRGYPYDTVKLTLSRVKRDHST